MELRKSSFDTPRPVGRSAKPSSVVCGGFGRQPDSGAVEAFLWAVLGGTLAVSFAMVMLWCYRGLLQEQAIALSLREQVMLNVIVFAIGAAMTIQMPRSGKTSRRAVIDIADWKRRRGL